jgi:biotin synthase
MTSTSEAINSILSRAVDGQELCREEVISLLSLNDQAGTEALFRAADRVRQEYVGDEIFLRGIIEFSSSCRNNCRYCGLRRDNKGLRRYRIPDHEIVELAKAIEAGGCTTVVLQSGEDPYYTRERLYQIISRIAEETSLAVTLSLGERSWEDLRAFKAAGADRYLLRHETANPELFAGLCPGRSLDTRIQCLRNLRKLGYEVGSGCMVGLPGQTVEDLADDILLMKRLDIDMAGIGPFIPQEQTPLKDCPAGDVNVVLRMVAVTRLVTKDTNIPSTTALGVLDKEIRKQAFHAGANVFMPDFTPHSYARDYEIYAGKGLVSSDARKTMDSYLEFFRSMGRPIGKGKGFRPGCRIRNQYAKKG